MSGDRINVRNMILNTYKPIRKRLHNRNTGNGYEEKIHRGRNQISRKYEKMFNFLNNQGNTNINKK